MLLLSAKARRLIDLTFIDSLEAVLIRNLREASAQKTA
jgi:hypothetical protein